MPISGSRILQRTRPATPPTRPLVPTERPRRLGTVTTNALVPTARPVELATGTRTVALTRAGHCERPDWALNSDQHAAWFPRLSSVMNDPLAAAFLRINGSCRVAMHEFVWRFSSTGGPGGQHANTSNTKVDLSFDVEHSPSLGPRQRERMLAAIGPVARVTASDTRSQTRNRELALQRLQERLQDGLHVETPRRATKPSKVAKQTRVDSKKHRASTKQQRKRPGFDD